MYGGRDPVGRASPSRAPRARRWRPRCCGRPGRGASGWSGPNCLGLINTDDAVRLHATFADVPTRRGRLSLLSESGMLGAVLVTTAHEAGLGLSSFLALGNRADVSGNDLLQYWEADDTTEVVGMYIESFGNPRNFSRLARRLTRVKPVVAVKAGASPTPTGRSETPPRTRCCGRPACCACPRSPRSSTPHACSSTSRCPPGLGSRCWATPVGRSPSPPTPCSPRSSSWPIWRPRRSPRSPPRSTPDAVPGTVDLGPHAGAHDVERATAALVADPGVDAVLVLYAEGLGATTDEAVAAIAHRAQGPAARCRWSCAPTGLAAPGRPRCPCSTPSTPRPTRSVGWRRTPPSGRSPRARCSRCEDGPGRRPRDSSCRSSSTPDEPSSAMSRRSRCSTPIGLRILRTEVATDVDEAEAAAASMGYPVVLKAAGRAPTAKTAAAGFAIDLEGPDALRIAWERMADGLGDDLTPALVQPMVAPGVDVAVRVSDHPTVGPVLSIGLGGAAAALDRPTDVRVLPLTDLDAARLVAGSRLASALDERRPGGPGGGAAPGGRAHRGGARGDRAHPQPPDRAEGHGGRHPGPRHDRCDRARPVAARSPSLSLRAVSTLGP